MTYDVIVSGLGGMGSATAYQLHKLTSVIEEILAIDGSTLHPIGLFSPDRLAARE